MILTIGIPVFNGQNCIKKTLKSISDDLGNNFVSSVEVLVSDNCSTDETFNEVKEFSSLPVKYYKNSKNYGYDFNVDQVVNLSSGEYVWFLGCGEVVKKNSIDLLLRKIQLYKPSSIILNYDIYEEESNSVVNEWVYQYGSDVILSSKNKKIPRYSVSLSANVINRKKWLENKQDLIEKDWIHVERILSMQSQKDFCHVILNDLYFTLYREKDGWWTKKNSYNLILQHINILQNSKSLGIEKKISNALARNISYFPLLHSVIIARKRGVKYSKELLLKYLRVQRPFFIMFVIIPTLCIHRKLLFLPEFLLNSFTKIKILVKYIVNFSKNKV